MSRKRALRVLCQHPWQRLAVSITRSVLFCLLFLLLVLMGKKNFLPCPKKSGAMLLLRKELHDSRPISFMIVRYLCLSLFYYWYEFSICKGLMIRSTRSTHRFRIYSTFRAFVAAIRPLADAILGSVSTSTKSRHSFCFLPVHILLVFGTVGRTEAKSILPFSVYIRPK